MAASFLEIGRLRRRYAFKDPIHRKKSTRIRTKPKWSFSTGPMSLWHYCATVRAHRERSYYEHDEGRGLRDGSSCNRARAAAGRLAEVRAPYVVVVLRI